MVAKLDIIRQQILATGQVQGVGFRPFIYRLAHIHNLSGNVSNTSQGVCIEVQGIAENINNFLHDLKTQLPPLANLLSCTQSLIPIKENEINFKIIGSQGHGGHSVLISADTSICAQCTQDIFEHKNRRYHYPFTNCTNCGPRYTITHSIPYDRSTTSMACFPLCQECLAEYENPLNRRFHAQPNACPVCGPRVWCVEDNTSLANTSYANAPAHLRDDEALKTMAIHLKNGKLAAIKGLGGFHLCCDAHNEASITLLRKRKNRPHKPLAIMVANLDMARRIAHIAPEHEALLTSHEKPIVLCPKIEGSLPKAIAPDADSVGIVLAYTPLHMVLFKHYASLFKHANQDIIALVMTSGNAGGEPICLGNKEALHRLAHIADVFLLHNRDILVRTDDSVCNTAKNINKIIPQMRNTFLRRARGYVPRPIQVMRQEHIAKHTPSILGMGAELKSTLCLSRGHMAFLSQHIGDLQNVETLSFYNEVMTHLEMLLEVQAKAIVHDLHPNFMSTQVAKEIAHKRDIPCLVLQHHFAHAWAVLGEHNFEGKALALTLDGTGLGLDGSIWGGELLYIDTNTLEHQRLGRLAPFSLAGGDVATKEPWRIALALAHGTSFEQHIIASHEKWGPAVLEMLARGVNCIQTSSVGRLFDGVAAALGLCTHTSYEGQAAIRLEYAQSQLTWKNDDIKNTYPCMPIKSADTGLWELPTQELFLASLDEYFTAKQDIAHVARRFHISLAQGFAHMAKLAADEVGTSYIALSGGAMQNGVLHTLLPYLLSNMGLQVLMHKNAPANDGGIALGQVAWGLKSVI